MSAPSDVTVTVTGGTGGIVANRGVIEHLAALFGASADALQFAALSLQGEAGRLGTPLFGGAFGGAGSLDPAGYAAASFALTDAAREVRTVADSAGDLTRKLRGASQGYPWGSDALRTGVLDQVTGLLRGIGGFGSSGAGSVAGQDPRTIDVLTRLAGPTQLSELASGGDDGLGVAVALGTATVVPPRGLVDLVTGLTDVDRQGTPGGIDVRVLTGADGSRHAVVDITGTRTWGAGGPNPAVLATNSAALIGKPTAYSKGVVAALRQAGVRADDPVMLVGHSQGGLVAVDTARELARSGEFHVTHVVTAGSPVAAIAPRLPGSIRLLALENARDLVPRLDGSPTVDRPNVTTVTGSTGDGSVGGNHSLERAYLPLAGAAERADSRSVRDFVTSARGFLVAAHAEQHSFRVERR